LGPVAGSFFIFMETRSIVAIVLAILILLFYFRKLDTKKTVLSTKFLTRTALFASLSIILYLVPVFNISLPIFPTFLQIHLDEIPIFISGFAYGPLSAIFILIIKTVAKLPLTTTAAVGELADLVYSSCFVLPAVFIYKSKRNIKSAVAGFGIGTLTQLLGSALITVIAILPFYIHIMGWSEQALLSMCQAVNKNVTSLGWPYVLFIHLPFNLIKDGAVIIITFILYKRLHKLIDSKL